jgi:hypothetical protein
MKRPRLTTRVIPTYSPLRAVGIFVAMFTSAIALFGAVVYIIKELLG